MAVSSQPTCVPYYPDLIAYARKHDGCAFPADVLTLCDELERLQSVGKLALDHAEAIEQQADQALFYLSCAVAKQDWQQVETALVELRKLVPDKHDDSIPF